MNAKILIRNITGVIFQGLEFLAGKNERSVESEARFAINKYVEAQMQKDVRSPRLIEVSIRLTEALGQVNSFKRGGAIKPSKIAEAVGEQRAEDAENWFTGLKEPTFKQLDSIAEYLGCGPEFLKHGDGELYPTEYCRIPEDAEEGIEWLLNPDGHKAVIGLHFLRSADETGSLVIVKQYDKIRCKVFTTPYHISEHIGNGGETALKHLSVLFELLYKIYPNMPEMNIKSYLVNNEDLRPVFEGKTHPLFLIQGDAKEQPWWEDIWDFAQVQKSNYWPGWRELCARINRIVEMSPRVVKERESIRDGTHPLLKSDVKSIHGTAVNFSSYH